MAVGHEQHSIKDWINFTDDELSKMGKEMVELWAEWKLKIQEILTANTSK